MLLQRLSLLMVLMCSRPKSVKADLILKPQDTEVVIGDSTYFDCASNVDINEVNWHHYAVGAKHHEDICLYCLGRVHPQYENRIVVDRNFSTGNSRLRIKTVKRQDAGRYICQDNGGIGESTSAQLVVLESTPECWSSVKPYGFVGPNSCNMSEEKLQLSCRVSYNGNIPPMLQWKMAGNDVPILEGIATDYSGKRATVNLTMSSTVEMDGDVFMCGTTRSQDKQLSCTTDPTKINYAVGQHTILSIAKGNGITCSANASVPCTCRWLYGKYAQHPVSYNKVLTTNRLGEHSCEASCPINGISCTFVAMRIIVFEEETSTASEDNTKTLLIAIGILIPTVVILLIIIACVMFFRIRKASSSDNRRSSNASTAAKDGTAEEKVRLQEDASAPGLTEKYISDPVLIETIRTKAAQEGYKNLISGLTILGKELFVVSGLSSQIEVYDSTKLGFNRRLHFEELYDPMDIASCSKNKCLYILDSKHSEESTKILRVDPSGELINKWPTGGDYGWSLSVTDESNVILTLKRKNELNEFSPDGKLIREVNLSDAGIHSPWHAIKLTNGLFVVSHGNRDDDLHRVCTVNADGKLMKAFGGERGSSIGQMNNPVYLSADQNGFVLVADAVNCRVLLLDSNLEFKRELLTRGKHGLQFPRRILLDESTNLVCVAERNFAGLIKIFQF